MSHLTMAAYRAFLNQFELSGDLKALGLNYGVELQDATVLSTSTTAFRVRLPGLRTAAFNHEGLVSLGSTESGTYLFDLLGAAGSVFGVAAPTGAEGDPCYFMQGVEANFQQNMPVGELFSFTVDGETDEVLVQGTVMATGAQTASGNGTSRQLGAVATGQRVWAALFCTEFDGTTLDVTVESDDNSGMTSSVSRITFTQLTDVGFEMLSAAGAITDDWWRVDWTATITSATFHVFVGIL